MCGIENKNNCCCHEDDLLCCCPVMHCCGGYSEHNNCCPHNRGCCNQCCGGPCGGCCDCCYMKYYKLLQKYKDEIDLIINDIKIDINDLRSWYEMLNNRLTEIYNNFSQDITNINNRIIKLDGEAIKKIKYNGTTYTPNDKGQVELPIGKLNCNNASSLLWDNQESFAGNINLHRISKTGNFSDLGGIPNFVKKVKVNGNTKSPDDSGIVTLPDYPTANDLNVPTGLELTCTDDYKLRVYLKEGDSRIESSKSNIIDLPLESVVLNGRYDERSKSLILTLVDPSKDPIVIPIEDLIGGLIKNSQIGVLNTSNSLEQSINPAEQLLGDGEETKVINLHKISKTGKYSDLIGAPTIPSAPGKLNTTLSTSQDINASESLSGTIKLHKISKTGAYNDLAGRPTIVNKIKIGQNGGTYSANEDTITIPEYPVVSASTIKVTIGGDEYTLQGAIDYIVARLLWELDSNGKVSTVKNNGVRRDAAANGFYDTSVS